MATSLFVRKPFFRLVQAAAFLKFCRLHISIA